MEFIKQLAGFVVMVSSGGGIMGKTSSQLEDLWILSANARDEALLLQPMTQEEKDIYTAWVNKYLVGAPEAIEPGTLEPELEAVIPEETVPQEEVPQEEEAPFTTTSKGGGTSSGKKNSKRKKPARK